MHVGCDSNRRKMGHVEAHSVVVSSVAKVNYNDPHEKLVAFMHHEFKFDQGRSCMLE